MLDAPTQDEYWLEGDECQVCLRPQEDVKQVPLKSLEAEVRLFACLDPASPCCAPCALLASQTKFTHNTKAVRLNARQSLSHILLKITDLSPQPAK